jgi:hypothetical protein
MYCDQISWHHVHHRRISNGIIKEAEDASLIGGGFREGGSRPDCKRFRGSRLRFQPWSANANQAVDRLLVKDAADDQQADGRRAETY